MFSFAFSLTIFLIKSFFFLRAEGFAACGALGSQCQDVIPNDTILRPPPTRNRSCTAVFARKKGKAVRAGVRSGGFGGAATEPCACGSTKPYNKCCGQIHRDPKAYAQATADKVVRARYTAYAKRVVEFIIQSTHPKHKSFQDDIAHWRKTIASDCFDDFELNKCEILDSSTQGEGDTEVATVRFLAHLRQRGSGERTTFIETSTFERDPKSRAWLYKNGVVRTVENGGNTS